MTDASPRYDVVIPTIGRSSLGVLLERLAHEPLPASTRLWLVDDRKRDAAKDVASNDDAAGLASGVPRPLADRTSVVSSGGRGPAAARNAGWRASSAPWIVFLDDDVIPGEDWAEDLTRDLAGAADDGAVQARVTVPAPTDRPPTDRERNVARLATAAWITADLAVRRSVLEDVGGFDERFPRAYREDTDFQLRAERAGHPFRRGRRLTLHPPSAGPWWASIAAQRGNADDALLRALHGDGALDRGRRRRHELITAAAAAAAVAAMLGRRRLTVAAAAAWLLGTSELAAARIKPGPKDRREITTMLATSVVIPPAATYHWWRGRWRWRAARRERQDVYRRGPGESGVP